MLERINYLWRLFGTGISFFLFGAVGVFFWGMLFPLIEKLKYEKDVIGIYLTGHPLDNYKLELNRYCNTTVSDLKIMQKARSGEGGDDIKVAWQ